MKRKVAIVGFAPSTRDKAPYNDPEWEIWVLNEYFSILPQTGASNITRWFELHQKETVLLSSRSENYMEHLKASKVPIMMVDKYDDIPMAERYPLEDIIKELQTDYFTNSISYMVAYAIYLKYDEIAIYGVDMAQDEEYCVHPDTKVLTKEFLYKKASELQIDEEIIAFDENPQGNSNDRDYRIAKVEGSNRITRPCYKLTFEDGSEITCSKEHRWLVGGSSNKWVQTENLIAKGERKDESCSHVIKPLKYWDEERTYEAGYLAAALDGEGHLTQSKDNKSESYNTVFGFAQKDNDMLKEFISYVNMYKFDFRIHQKQCGANCLAMSKRSEVIRFLGQIRPKRLISKLDIEKLGRMVGEKVALVKKEYIGEQEVIALGTSTGTFIAEGFASHNSKERPSVEYFVGYARAKGIPVYIPAESDICKVPYYYGFQEASAQKIVRTIDPKLNDLKTRINHDDFVVDEMQEYIDYKLKKYLFEYHGQIQKIKDTDAKIGQLQEKQRNSKSQDECNGIQQEIIKIQTELPNLAILLYQLHDLIMGLWNDNQNMKGAKKERLFLSGAENMTSHLRKILCPYD